MYTIVEKHKCTDLHTVLSLGKLKMTDVCHEVRVKTITQEVEGIHSFVLVPLVGEELPPFSAGSHINVHMRPGLIRSYSIVNSSKEHNRYVLAIARNKDGRGGSNYMLDEVKVGQILKISSPSNNFPLNEKASNSVLIAGGIGITPIWSMIQRLQDLGLPWTLHYCARSRESAAFLEEIENMAINAGASGKLFLHFDDELNGARPDLNKIIDKTDSSDHLYCCGPQAMLDVFQSATKNRSKDFVHFEYFGATEQASLDGGYRLILSQSQKTIEVPAGKTMLDTLLEAGVNVQYGCMQGVCGCCEVQVLDGIPDHRDSILTDSAKASNKTILVCCSGSKSPTLTLDL